MRTRAWIAALAVGLASARAFAAEPTDVEVKNARARFDEGRALAGQGHYDEARVKFLQAWAVLKTSPDVLFNLALAEKKSLHPVESIRHFRVLVRDPSLPSDLSERAKQYIAELSAVTGHVKVHAPDGADISVDGVVVGREPIDDPIDVLAGHSTISASLDGKTAQQDVTLGGGATTEITLSIPGHTASNGGGHGTPPSTTTESYRSAAGWIVPITVGVAGLAGIGVGIGFGAASQSAKTDRDALLQRGVCFTATSPACATYTDKVNAVNTDTTASLIGYIAGGVLLAGAATLFVVWPKSVHEVTVTPTVGPTGAGVSLSGHF